MCKLSYDVGDGMKIGPYLKGRNLERSSTYVVGEREDEWMSFICQGTRERLNQALRKRFGVLQARAHVLVQIKNKNSSCI